MSGKGGGRRGKKRGKGGKRGRKTSHRTKDKFFESVGITGSVKRPQKKHHFTAKQTRNYFQKKINQTIAPQNESNGDGEGKKEFEGLSEKQIEKKKIENRKKEDMQEMQEMIQSSVPIHIPKNHEILSFFPDFFNKSQEDEKIINIQEDITAPQVDIRGISSHLSGFDFPELMKLNDKDVELFFPSHKKKGTNITQKEDSKTDATDVKMNVSDLDDLLNIPEISRKGKKRKKNQFEKISSLEKKKIEKITSDGDDFLNELLVGTKNIKVKQPDKDKKVDLDLDFLLDDPVKKKPKQIDKDDSFLDDLLGATNETSKKMKKKKEKKIVNDENFLDSIL